MTYYHHGARQLELQPIRHCQVKRIFQHPLLKATCPSRRTLKSFTWMIKNRTILIEHVPMQCRKTADSVIYFLRAFMLNPVNPKAQRFSPRPLQEPSTGIRRKLP
jgi:hypothetical protein